MGGQTHCIFLFIVSNKYERHGQMLHYTCMRLAQTKHSSVDRDLDGYSQHLQLTFDYLDSYEDPPNATEVMKKNICF